MSAKVLNVMQQMLARPELVQETYRSGREVFFRYGGFAFSMLHAPDRDANYGNYSFYVYPAWHQDLRSLANASEESPESIGNMVSYNSGEFGTEEEKQFRDLYTMILGKNAGVDRVFDMILSTK